MKNLTTENTEGTERNFWVVDQETLGGSMKAVHGPFDTQKAAANFILNDFKDWWMATDIPLDQRDEETCGCWLILEQIAHVQPFGKSTLVAKLKEVGK